MKGIILERMAYRDFFMGNISWEIFLKKQYKFLAQFY